MAPKFFALVKEGTPVNIADSQPEDITFGRTVARPKDYQDPDPAEEFMISERVFAKPNEPLFTNE